MPWCRRPCTPFRGVCPLPAARGPRATRRGATGASPSLESKRVAGRMKTRPPPARAPPPAQRRADTSPDWDSSSGDSVAEALKAQTCQTHELARRRGCVRPRCVGQLRIERRRERRGPWRELRRDLRSGAGPPKGLDPTPRSHRHRQSRARGRRLRGRARAAASQRQQREAAAQAHAQGLGSPAMRAWQLVLCHSVRRKMLLPVVVVVVRTEPRRCASSRGLSASQSPS